MPANEIVEKLVQAEIGLDCAIRSLLEMDAPLDTCPASLEHAAALVGTIQFPDGARMLRASIEPRLQSIAAKALTARRLLDSAATLYFGSVLNQGCVEQGYSATGNSGSFGGGSLRVEA